MRHNTRAPFFGDTVFSDILVTDNMLHITLDLVVCVCFKPRPMPFVGLPWDNRGKCHTGGKRIQCL